VVVFPNPTERYLHSESFEKASEINIYDLIGHKVKSLQLPSQQIDLKYLASGIYFLEININGNRFVRKFIKC